MQEKISESKCSLDLLLKEQHTCLLLMTIITVIFSFNIVKIFPC